MQNWGPKTTQHQKENQNPKQQQQEAKKNPKTTQKKTTKPLQQPNLKPAAMSLAYNTKIPMHSDLFTSVVIIVTRWPSHPTCGFRALPGVEEEDKGSPKPPAAARRCLSPATLPAATENLSSKRSSGVAAVYQQLLIKTRFPLGFVSSALQSSFYTQANTVF